VLSISSANSAEDFEIAAGLCQELAEWDVVQAQPYGLSRDEVIATFHGETAGSLATKYNSADAKLLIARWEATPAGCLAFDPFDETAVELHKFYVDARFRGRGIGSGLMRTALAAIGKGRRRKVLIHTTPYMKDAISLYESHGFANCPRFRSTPDRVGHTDVFMSRAI
jgi:GNAT superfamily N-acetyltransferase